MTESIISNKLMNTSFIPKWPQINEKIIEKNKDKKTNSILSNLYKIDDRAIKFKQAKNELIKMTNSYLSRHFEKQTNSRDLLTTIQE